MEDFSAREKIALVNIQTNPTSFHEVLELRKFHQILAGEAVGKVNVQTLVRICRSYSHVAGLAVLTGCETLLRDIAVNYMYLNDLRLDVCVSLGKGGCLELLPLLEEAPFTVDLTQAYIQACVYGNVRTMVALENLIAERGLTEDLCVLVRLFTSILARAPPNTFLLFRKYLDVPSLNFLFVRAIESSNLALIAELARKGKVDFYEGLRQCNIDLETNQTHRALQILKCVDDDFKAKEGFTNKENRAVLLPIRKKHRHVYNEHYVVQKLTTHLNSIADKVGPQTSKVLTDFAFVFFEIYDAKLKIIEGQLHAEEHRRLVKEVYPEE